MKLFLSSVIKNKNLLIAHHFCSEPFLTFYKIEENENFNISLLLSREKVCLF